MSQRLEKPSIIMSSDLLKDFMVEKVFGCKFLNFLNCPFVFLEIAFSTLGEEQILNRISP